MTQLRCQDSKRCALGTYSWEANQIYFIKVDSIRMPGLVSRAVGSVIKTTKALQEIEEQGLREAGDILHYPGWVSH